jgi:hypothetical protein
MTKKIVLGVMTIALVGFVAVPSASAACIPAKTAQTFSANTAYWLPATSVGTLSGQAWQLGAPGNFASTGCVDILSAVGDNITLVLDLGSCGAGCPGPLGANTLAVLAQNRSATGGEFLLATIAETPASAVNYDYSTQGDHTMIKIPRPRVLSSARVGNNVNLSVAVDSVAAGLFGPNAASAISGFNILTKSSATDPGSDASQYSLRSTVPSPGGAAVTQPISLDCTNPQDQWIVTQIQFENGTVLGNTTSGATRVRCDPALAAPKTPSKVKVAPKVRAN